MKVLKTILFLLILSLQANASGYTHNMFVAHKKLQTFTEPQVVSVKQVKQIVKIQTKEMQANKSIPEQLSEQLVGFYTLNQRILQESRISFFSSEEERYGGNTIVGSFINSLQKMVFLFLGI